MSNPFGYDSSGDPPPKVSGGGVALGVGLTIVVPVVLAMNGLIVIAVVAYFAMFPMLLVSRPVLRGVAIGVLITGAIAALLFMTCVALVSGIG